MKKILPLIAALTLASSAHALHVRANFVHYADADLKDSQNGKVSTSTFALTGGTDNISGVLKHTDFKFSGMPSVIDSTDLVGLDFRYKFELLKTMGAFVGAGAYFSFEDELDLDKAYNIAARAGVSYSLNKMFTFYGGFATSLNKAENRYLPIVGVEIGNERKNGFSGSLAYPMTRLTYRLNEALSFDSYLITITENTQLDRNKNLGRSGFGYMLEESYALGFKAKYKFPLGLQVSAGINALLDREYKLFDKDGNEKSKWETDPAIGFSANVSYKFF